MLKRLCLPKNQQLARVCISEKSLELSLQFIGDSHSFGEEPYHQQIIGVDKPFFHPN